MSTLDIRKDIPSPVNKILFGDEAFEGTLMAHKLTRFHHDQFVAIGDSSSDRVLLHSKAHAMNAIKAIEQAIALGWLK